MTYQFRLREEPFEFYEESDEAVTFLDGDWAEEAWEREVDRRSPEYIRWVQSRLNRILGLRLPVNGVLTPATRSAIRSYQSGEGLPVDGIVGPETERALISARGGHLPTASHKKLSAPGMTEPIPPAAEFDFEGEHFDDDLTDAVGTAETETEWFESEREEGLTSEISKPPGVVEAKRNSLGAWAASTLDTATNGKLYWFNSKNGGSTTAVYVPDAALATDPLCLLVWIHGLLVCGGEGVNAVSYVKSKKFPLARQIADSKRPFVLVAPSMKWKNGQDSHPLGSPKNLNAFLEEVRTGLTAAGWSSAPSFARLILAGHSKAFAVFNGLAARVRDPQSSQGALARLTDMWLLDTTYGKMHKETHCKNWMGWAKAKRGVNLRIFYRRNSDTAAVAECIRDEAAAARLTNVVVKDFDRKALLHCDMPLKRMPDLLAASGNCPARSKGPSAPPAPGTLAPNAPSPAPRPTNGSLFQQIQNALASSQWYLAISLAVLSGDRDANRLTNMIFFARHPKLKGRKLVNTDPHFKQLSQEWSDIRDRIVRPFLNKTTPAKPSTATPTTPMAGSKPYPEVNMPLPRSGPAFDTYKPTSQQYALPETVAALQKIGAAWQSAHPRGPRIRIGDISLRGGGPMPGHKSHQKGVDVDVRLMRNDGREEPTTYQSPQYSRALTQELINLIRANGILKVRYIFFNDPAAKGVSPWPNHDNHLHVRFIAPGKLGEKP